MVALSPGEIEKPPFCCDGFLSLVEVWKEALLVNSVEPHWKKAIDFHLYTVLSKAKKQNRGTIARISTVDVLRVGLILRNVPRLIISITLSSFITTTCHFVDSFSALLSAMSTCVHDSVG